MRTIIKARWAVIAVWLIAAVGLFLVAPGMEDLVREKGQVAVPEGYSSRIAEDLLKEASGDEGDATSVALVFHHEDGLNAEKLTEIEQAIRTLSDQGEELGITSLMTHFDQPELEDQFVAEDGKTILAAVQVELKERSAKEVTDALYGALDDVSVEHYFTASWMIDEDVVVSSQEGLKKTEYITVAFIVIILLLVFRSPVAPIIPLATVGLSYLAAQSVVAFLIDSFNFPVSTFTQIFMVAVMFGIGTDYCILLISRFKEQLAQGDDKGDAILSTYKTAGRTVLFSGLAVLVGFTSIGFSTFSLYQSAVAVAVGVAVMMIALYTVVPFFMMTLGKALFWPVKGTLVHKENRFWSAAGKFSLKRPLITLALVAALVVPFLVVYDGELSFNSMEEIGEKYDSVKGFNLIADAFGPGESMPTTVIAKSTEPLDDAEGLALIENVSRELARLDGVAAVRSATRPMGEVLDDFSIANQAEMLKEGLEAGQDGLVQIRDGLAEAGTLLSDSAPELERSVESVGLLVAGTAELSKGIEQLGDGIRRVEAGLKEGALGARELQQAMAEVKAGADQLAAVHQQLAAGYGDVGAGLAGLADQYDEVANGLARLAQGLQGMSQNLESLGVKYPELHEDADYIAARMTAGELQAGAGMLQQGLTQLNAGLRELQGGVATANAGYTEAVAGQQQLAAGISALLTGIEQLADGIEQAAAGQGQIAGGIPELANGAEQIRGGQAQMQEGFSEFHYRLAELASGLNQSADGLTQVVEGLSTAQEYLGQLSTADDSPTAGWHAPEEALADAQFSQVLDVYLSPDRKLAKWEVILENNPYDTSSLQLMEEVKAAFARAAVDTKLAEAEFAVGGVTSIYADLDQVSASDYSRTVLFMIAGLSIILIVLLRSLIMPLYLIASLIVTYFTSISVAELIFTQWFGYSGLSWAVPFFAFVILMALGIDYSIFLMDRFNEYKHLRPEEAIWHAMKNMGTVIISAAVILGGTFAAMLPSGVLSILEIATVVLTGLFLYAFVLLPLFVPVMVKTFDRANWWPFRRPSDSGHDQDPDTVVQTNTHAL